MHKIIVLFVLSFLFINTSFSQFSLSGVEYQPEEEMKVLEEKFTAYKIYQIDVNKDDINISSKNPFLDLELGERIYNLNLYTDNITISYENGNKPHLLGGSLRHGGLASLTINDDFIFGFIKEGSTVRYIEPLRHLEKNASNDLFIVYYLHDVLDTGDHKCGVEEVEAKDQSEQLNKMVTDACKIVDYAIANTFDMVAELSGVTNVMNFNLAVLNDVQTNYRSEFDTNVEYNVVAHYVPSSAANNPLQPLTGVANASTILSNFRNWGDGGGNTGGATGGFGVDYEMAGLWTDVNIESSTGNTGVVGLAYRPGWHHLFEEYDPLTAADFQALVSHEIGHNWNYLHDASGSSFIMAPSVTRTFDWSSSSKTTISNRLSSGSTAFLTTCNTLPVANYFHSIAACTNNATVFEDQSQYGATRNWLFTNGSPSTSTSEKPSVTYSTSGLNYVKITSTNNSGSDDYENYVDAQPAPPTICTPSGSGGTSGIQHVFLNGMSNFSSASGIYEDFSCSEIAILDLNTTYNMRIRLLNVTHLRLFADFNNDGDFSDTGESLIYYNTLPSANFNLSLNINIPSSAVSGELLRFRVTSSNSSISSNGCSSPASGQVEDYSIYFPVAQILGCTDPSASNYNPNATVDDGSCSSGSQTWYRDMDNDTYGDINVSQQAVSQPSGYVLDNTDCDDAEAASFPGNPEICDGLDNNCDGNIDEGVISTWYRDLDGDSFGNPTNTTQACTQPSGYVSDNTDCDDNDSDEFPGQLWHKDIDGDGYGDGTNVSQCLRPTNYYTSTELIVTSGDCDDNEAAAFPGNPEICDGIDNNCNNSIDEGTMTTYYRDMDNDNYGDPNVFTQGCSQPSGYVLDNTDCDDNEAAAFPGNPEICDGIDNNCDNNIDEGTGTRYYRDLDVDGFGDAAVTMMACSPPNGFVLDDTDCDDLDADEFPGQIWYRDIDGDDYGSGNQLVQCERPANYYTVGELTSTSGDCDDNEPTTNPAAQDICGDGIDNNCNGFTDEPCGPCDGSSLTISTISQNEYRASIDITSDALLNNNQSILFSAEDEILLEGDFEVQAGTVFLADIYPCTTTAQDESDSPVSSNKDPLALLEIAIKESLEKEEKTDVSVYNKWGEVVFEANDTELDGISTLLKNNIIDLPTGYYLLNAKSGEKTFTKSIFVE